jgi:hypothetical protein
MIAACVLGIRIGISNTCTRSNQDNANPLLAVLTGWLRQSSNATSVPYSPTKGYGYAAGPTGAAVFLVPQQDFGSLSGAFENAPKG